MLVTEKSKQNALIEYGRYGAYNGTGNYVKNNGQGRFPLAVKELEKSLFPAVYEKITDLTLDEDKDNEKPLYVIYQNEEKKKKGDLPLTTELLSDVDYEAPPTMLRYVRLDGLKYYTKR